MNERNEWIDIITKLYRKLHLSPVVMHTASESDKKRDRILKYFERLDRVHNQVAQSKNKNAEKLLKSFYYNLYVIKPEDIPNSYFEHEKQILRDRGYGDIELTPERKKMITNQIIEDQKHSLDRWIEYFLYDEESENYEIWEKYWVFQGIQILGKYDKESGKFSKRDKHTTYPFPPVDREAIFTTLKLMEDFIKDKTGEEEIRSALGSGNFKTLYEYAIKMRMQKGKKQSTTTEGIWVKYEQGSDYNKLRDSLQDYYTGWCTAAGENFAKSQLEKGDFYVYYTYNENNEAKVPRIAIRMEGHEKIAEIRGIAADQNMESEMLPILNKKLEEFPDRNNYLKKEHDMQVLTAIDRKVQRGVELGYEELNFLYEIDDRIEGFGYEKDPRINEIKNKRNIIDDLNKIFSHPNCNLDRYLDLSDLTSAKGLTFPQSIEGSLDLKKLTSAEGLVLPQSIEGSLNLKGLTSTEGLVLPQHIGGDLSLSGLTSAEGLVLPQSIGGFLDLSGLTSTEGLILPQSIGEDLYLNGLTSTEGLTFPQSIRGSLDLSGLTSTEGLVLPQSIGGTLDLSGLTSTEGLTLSQHIGRDLNLSGLTSAEGLTLPQHIGRDLNLNGLTSAEGVTFPQHIGRDLNLSGLTSAEGLTLPQSVGRDLDLSSLTSTKGLTLPQSISGSLDLSGLTSAEGLILPQSIRGSLDLSGLTSTKGLTLPQSIGKSLYLNELTSAEGLTLPKSIGGDLNLSGLTSAEGLILPRSIKGTLALSSLTSAERLILPQNIEWYLDLSGLTSAEGLKLPVGFDLNRLMVSEEIKEQIRANINDYYQVDNLVENEEYEQENYRTR